MRNKYFPARTPSRQVKVGRAHGRDEHFHLGTLTCQTETKAADGHDLNHEIRICMARHKRLARGPKGIIGGRRLWTLADGTLVETIIIPQGLEPAYIVRVVPPETSQGLIIIGEYMLEHGMMLLPAVPDSALEIYTAEEMTDYLLSSGTIIPGQDDLQYLIGPFDLGAEAYWITDSTYYQGGNYSSLVWNTPTRLQNLLFEPYMITPCAWTGLSRLWAQCLTGSGTLTGEAATGIDLNPQTDGIVRLWGTSLDGDQTFHYFLVRINPEGVKAWPATHTAVSQVPLNILVENELGTLGLLLTDEERRKHEAWVMAGLRFSEDEEISVLSASEIADVYENGAWPLAHGWSYSRQRLGTTLETLSVASIVTTSNIDTGAGAYLNSSHWHVTFALQAGTLAAGLTAQERDTTWHGSVSELLWIPVGGSGAYELLEGAGGNGWATGYGDDGPLYCFWGDDDEHVFRFTNVVTISSEVGGSLPKLYVCHSGTDSCSAWSRTNVQRGGPYVTNSSGNANVAIATSDSYAERTLTVTASGGPECITPEGGPYIDAYILSSCSDEFPGLGPINNCKRITTELASAVEERTDSVRTGDTGRRVGIIAHTPECVYVMYRKLGDGLERFRRYSYSAQGGLPFRASTDVQYYLGDEWGPYPHWISGAWTSAAAWTTSDECYAYSAGIGQQSPQTDEETEQDQVSEQWLVTSSGTRELNQDYDSWAFFYPIYDNYRYATITITESFHEGEGWYYQTPSEVVRTDTDIPTLPSQSTFIPIGVS